uniref:Non-structural protein 2 n=1 Tax=Rotavirus A TaxID=28875 RepID=A0A6M3QVA6_9REOV|nr:NSP2 [Rotavirus A]
MAELACFCYPTQDHDSYKFSSYTRLAIKCMLSAKVEKSLSEKFYNTLVYGIAPPPQFKKRFSTSENSRGVNYDCQMFDKVSNLICSVLNQHKINKTELQQVMARTVSVRHLENLILRMENAQDILHHSKEILYKAVAIAIGLIKEQETTITAEGGDIVFQNTSFTMWKLNYLQHQLMPMTDPNFIEYKITLNKDGPVAEQSVKELIAELRWQYNRFAAITHGKGHYRVVKYSTIMNHADRVYATYKTNCKLSVGHEFHQMDQRIVWQNWFAFTSSMIQGNTSDVCKKLLFQKMKQNKNEFKGLTAEKKFDEVSNVGV